MLSTMAYQPNERAYVLRLKFGIQYLYGEDYKNLTKMSITHPLIPFELGNSLV
jgi:hypothetical protein